MFTLTKYELDNCSKRIFSQHNQDGVLEAIFNQIGEGNKCAVEFGGGDGVELSNTANLRINKGWDCLLMDKEPRNELVKRAIIYDYNVDFLILHWFKFTEPHYLSIDIDGNEYWVFQKLEMKPAVISIEYNSKFNNDESYAIEYNPDHKWEGDDYYGASLLAFKKLGEKKGYTLVYVVDRFDAVFVRNDLISPDYVVPTLDELLPEPIIAHETKSTKKWVIV